MCGQTGRQGAQLVLVEASCDAHDSVMTTRTFGIVLTLACGGEVGLTAALLAATLALTFLRSSALIVVVGKLMVLALACARWVRARSSGASRPPSDGGTLSVLRRPQYPSPILPLGMGEIKINK